MDEILDHFFNSTSWTDVDVKERSSLDCFELPPMNEMRLSSIGVGKVDDDSNNSATNVTNSNQSIESIVLQSANPSIGHDFDSDAQHNGNNCTMDFSNDQICLQYDMDGNIVTSVSCLAPHNVGCECYDQSVFQGLNGEFETPSMVWPHQAYEGVSSSLCPPSIYESSDLITAETVKQEMGNHHLPSFASAPQIPMTMTGMQSFQQTTLANPSAEYNGPRKPRVRARRGQATDPHSIAERLRREKIADRMKNLQELVPKSNKTDKASMLDEIIEYVKFLQQEVKVLSARRSGAKGEVMLDNRAKGTNGISDSPSIGHDISFNEIAFEQVLKLMETDVTKAMQYLQSKGLCMMSLSLANTILAEKESSPSADSVENLKNVAGFPDDGLLHKPSSSRSNSATLPGSDKRC